MAIAGDRHGFAVLERLALGELGLQRLIKRHRLARELLKGEKHLLVEGKLRLGWLTVLAQAKNDALICLTVGVGVGVDFT